MREVFAEHEKKTGHCHRNGARGHSYEVRLLRVAEQARGRTRPRVYFEEWDEPLISGIGWVSELVVIAGGDAVFPELTRQAAAKDRIVTPEGCWRRHPRSSWPPGAERRWCRTVSPRGPAGPRSRPGSSTGDGSRGMEEAGQVVLIWLKVPKAAMSAVGRLPRTPAVVSMPSQMKTHWLATRNPPRFETWAFNPSTWAAYRVPCR